MVLADTRAEMALTLVARWMGQWYFDGAPCPTGQKAAYSGAGPMMVLDYEGCWHPQPPMPAIILEGIGGDWANLASEELREEFCEIGVLAIPLTGFILNLYPLGDS